MSDNQHFEMSDEMLQDMIAARPNEDWQASALGMAATAIAFHDLLGTPQWVTVTPTKEYKAQCVPPKVRVTEASKEHAYRKVVACQLARVASDVKIGMQDEEGVDADFSEVADLGISDAWLENNDIRQAAQPASRFDDPEGVLRSSFERIEELVEKRWEAIEELAEKLLLAHFNDEEGLNGEVVAEVVERYD